MISQENNHHTNNTQNKQNKCKNFQIPYIKYSHKYPLLKHTDIDTYLCLCTYDSYQEIIHFRYDPIANKNEVIDKLKICLGYTRLQTITIRTKSQNKDINNQQQQQITVYAVVLSAQLNYNEHIILWKLTKEPPIPDSNYAVIHRNNNNNQKEQYNIHIEIFAFQQSKMICFSKCLIANSYSNTIDNFVILAFYKVEDIVAEISSNKYYYKHKYDYQRVRFNHKQRYLAHKIDQIGTFAFVEKNHEECTNKCQFCFKIFSMSQYKQNKHKSQLIDVKLKLFISNKIRQNNVKQSVSDLYKNFQQKPAQTSDKTQNQLIYTTTINDIWLVQQQVLYLCLKTQQKKLKQPTKQPIKYTIQYFYNYKKQNLYQPAYKIEQKNYNVQFYNMFHRILRQNYSYIDYSYISPNCPIFFVSYSQEDQFVYNSLSVNKKINGSNCEFTKSYGFNRLDAFIIVNLKPIIVYTYSSEFPWKRNIIYCHLCLAIMNFNCDQDLLMTVNSLLVK